MLATGLPLSPQPVCIFCHPIRTRFRLAFINWVLNRSAYIRLDSSHLLELVGLPSQHVSLVLATE